MKLFRLWKASVFFPFFSIPFPLRPFLSFLFLLIPLPFLPPHLSGLPTSSSPPFHLFLYPFLVILPTFGIISGGGGGLWVIVCNIFISLIEFICKLFYLSSCLSLHIGSYMSITCLHFLNFLKNWEAPMVLTLSL